MSELMITEEDVRSFRDKLDAWNESLDDGERAILQLVMVRAFPESTAPNEWDEPDVVGFRDASSGLASGKRTHKPFVIIKQYDKATPMLVQGTLETFVGTSFVLG